MENDNAWLEKINREFDQKIAEEKLYSDGNGGLVAYKDIKFRCCVKGCENVTKHDVNLLDRGWSVVKVVGSYGVHYNCHCPEHPIGLPSVEQMKPLPAHKVDIKPKQLEYKDDFIEV